MDPTVKTEYTDLPKGQDVLSHFSFKLRSEASEALSPWSNSETSGALGLTTEPQQSVSSSLSKNNCLQRQATSILIFLHLVCGKSIYHILRLVIAAVTYFWV